MMDDDVTVIAQAHDAWQAGQRVQAGRLLFESLPKQARPKWASDLLKYLVERSGERDLAILLMLYVADHPERWKEAHRVFSSLRRTGLDLDQVQQKTHKQEILVRVLFLAELVAKVVYNATEPPDPFDSDAGWGIAVRFKVALDFVTDSDSGELAWSILSKYFQDSCADAKHCQ